MVRQFERLPERAKDDVGLPDCVFTFYDRLLAFDHLRHQLHIIAAADVRANRRAKRMIALSPTLPPSRQSWPAECAHSNIDWSTQRRKENDQGPPRTSHDEFVASVRRAKEYIAAGDIFQVVLSQRLDFKPPAEPFQIYRALRTVNPSPYMFFLKLDDMHVLGASPEMLVRVSGRKLEYRPIAGTHKRGADAGRRRTADCEVAHRRKGARRARHAGRSGSQRSWAGSANTAR